MSAKLKHYKEEIDNFLHQDNAFANTLAKVEEKTKVNRLHIFLGNEFAKSIRDRKISKLVSC
jgi:hypothetical protein